MREMKQLCACQLLLLFISVFIPIQSIGQVWLLPIYLEGKFNETKLEFYGILKDQDGLPVSGAKVKYTLGYVGLVKPMRIEKHALTNKDGRFELHGGKVAKLYIDSFELGGYAYEGTIKSFDFQKVETKRHRADKANPVEFRIRRRNQEAVPLMRVGFSLIIGTKEHDSWAGYDIKHGWSFSKMIMYSEENRPFSDFEMSGKYDAYSKTWTVTMRANGENAGFQFSEKVLYEAPADGYVKEMTMVYPVMSIRDVESRFPKYIYARVREPGFYMRAKIGHVIIDENKFVLQAAGMLNPFGSRCLEKLEITDDEESLRIDRVAHKALYDQKFAEQPECQKLIKEGKAKY